MIQSDILTLRKELHANPELSGTELNTAKRIKEFIQQHHPCEIIEHVGGHGLLAIFKFSETGKTVAIRCELDALPIDEVNEFNYKSVCPGVSHKCGHDGHMAIVAGLIFWIKKQHFTSGKIVLLFQPAEETGQGAQQVMKDDRFKQLNCDYIFALHNIPGESLHTIISMQEGFSAEVQSFALFVNGQDSHASEPEKGINPALALSAINHELAQLNELSPTLNNFAVLTQVYMNMGEKAYGISPGKGELHFTIRTWKTEIMDELKQRIQHIIKKICQSESLEYNIDWFEYFPASSNHTVCNDLVKEVALQNDFALIERPYPFKFGEDFGWFSTAYKTAMFGIGAGIHSPALHHSNYDFPDELLETGLLMFSGILSSILD